MQLGKSLAVALLALGLAVTAQAGPRLYDGTLIIHGFSNDTTDGTTAPFTYNSAFPIPFGNHCNTRPFHAHELIETGTYYNPSGTNGNYLTFTIPAYGGQVADVHSSYSYFAPEGCGAPTGTYGMPLTGKGTISTTGTISTARSTGDPRGFTMAEGALSIVTGGGSFLYAFPYLFTKTYAALRNASGSFGRSKGPGRYSTSPAFSFSQSGGIGSLKVRPGANRFGSTMKLLGTLYSISAFLSPPYDTNVAHYTWLFDYVGGTGQYNGTKITAPLYGSAYNYYIGVHYHFQAYTVAQAKVLSWTTGTASVTAVGGPFETILARKGFDHRDSYGYGEIQMVSPMLTRWIFNGGSKSTHTGSIGILRIRLAPEPHEWMLLSAGLSMLALLYRENRRSH